MFEASAGFGSVSPAGSPNIGNILGAVGELGKILNAWASGTKPAEEAPTKRRINPYGMARPPAQMQYRFPWAHPRGRQLLAAKRI